MKTTTFTIGGMHCDGCAETIQALLAREPGVRKAEVSLTRKDARVLHDPAQISKAALKAAIEKAGFKAATKRA
jgi:copper chaperone CopZ